MDVQDQIYVVSGSLGAVSFVLLILVCVLFVEISKLKKSRVPIHSSSVPKNSIPVRKERDDNNEFVGNSNGDMLEQRGFSEYKGASSFGQNRFEGQRRSTSPPRGLARQQSVPTAGYSGYQQQPPMASSSVPKQPHKPASVGYDGGHSGLGYGNNKSYDNGAYEPRDQRDITAGGVRVLPSGGASNQQPRRNNYENSGYY